MDPIRHMQDIEITAAQCHSSVVWHRREKCLSACEHNTDRDHRQLASCDAWQAAVHCMWALEKVCASAAACARHGFVHAFALAGQSWSDARRPSEPVRRPRSQCAGTCRAAAHRPGAAHGRTTLLPFALPKYSFSHTLGADPALSKVPTPCARGS